MLFRDGDFRILVGIRAEYNGCVALVQCTVQLVLGAGENAHDLALRLAGIARIGIQMYQHAVAVPCIAAHVRRNKNILRQIVRTNEGKAASGCTEGACAVAEAGGMSVAVFLAAHQTCVSDQCFQLVCERLAVKLNALCEQRFVNRLRCGRLTGQRENLILNVCHNKTLHNGCDDTLLYSLISVYQKNAQKTPRSAKNS